MTETMNFTQEWDKTFELSEEVEHKKVTFTNHFGITLVADLYQPKRGDWKTTSSRSVWSVWSGEEQSSWTLCSRKWRNVAIRPLLLIPSYTGESGGYPLLYQLTGCEYRRLPSGCRLSSDS